MDRRFRLTRSSEFQRVRSAGKTYAHPLVVLTAVRNGLDRSRYGVSAGRRCGGAVQRNRAKRRLRALWRRISPVVQSGWDIVLEARSGSVAAEAAALHDAFVGLCRRAGILEDRQ